MNRTAGNRPRWGRRLIGAVLAVALLAGAAEVALRLLLPGTLATAVRDGLGLTEDHPVEVSMGGSALLHAFRGGIGDVTIAIPDTPLLEGIEADATLRADLVPFNPVEGDIDGGSAELRIGKERLGSVIALLTQGIAQHGEVRDGSLMVGRSLEVFGQNVDLSATLGLAVTPDGEVEVEPRGVRAVGLDLDVEQISRATGGMFDALLEPQLVCVAEQLPAGITLTDISLSSTGAASISARLSPGILADPAEQRPGSCG